MPQIDLDEDTRPKQLPATWQHSEAKRHRSSPAEMHEQIEDTSYSDEDNSNSCEDIAEVAPIACDQPVELVVRADSAPPVTESIIPISESSKIQ